MRTRDLLDDEDATLVFSYWEWVAARIEDN